jgi:hypothetical protein
MAMFVQLWKCQSWFERRLEGKILGVFLGGRFQQ